MVLACCGPSRTSNCDDQFSPVLTDNGICYAFNPTSLLQSMKTTPYTNMFQSIFSFGNVEQEGVKIENTGKVYQMHITLDSHKSEINYERKMEHFILAINQRDDYMSTLDNGISLKNGYHTHVRLTPKKVTSTKRFDGLPIENRKCQQKKEITNKNSLYR